MGHERWGERERGSEVLGLGVREEVVCWWRKVLRGGLLEKAVGGVGV